MADYFNNQIKEISYYPQAKTPNLDKLAKQGVLFKNASCSSPVCNPSRNALWSGLRPATTKIWANSNNPDGDYVRDIPGFENIKTMNQYFTEHGYFTYGCGKLYHPAKMGAVNTDPTHWSQISTEGSGANGGNSYAWSNPNTEVSWSAGEYDVNQSNDTKLAIGVANLIKGYSASANKNKPFFIACGLFRPHLPWNVHKMFFDYFNPDTLDIPQGYKDNDLDDIVGASPAQDHMTIVAGGQWKNAKKAYLANHS